MVNNLNNQRQGRDTKIRPILKYVFWNKFGFYSTLIILFLVLLITLLWSLRPGTQPRYIFISVTWLWTCIVGSLEFQIEVLVRRRINVFTPLVVLLVYTILVGLFRAAYPTLMVYLGSIPSARNLSSSQKLAISVFRLLGLFFFVFHGFSALTFAYMVSPPPPQVNTRCCICLYMLKVIPSLKWQRPRQPQNNDV